jgi:uncharacterized protein YggU (UPF0235/DUF167 family)
MRIEVVVRPGLRHIEEKEGRILVYTTEPKERNKANIDVTKQIAKYFSVSSGEVRIISGQSSRRKVFEIGDR